MRAQRASRDAGIAPTPAHFTPVATIMPSKWIGIGSVGKPFSQDIRDEQEAQVKFQSTPPCGGRSRGGGFALVVICFNPRPRAGGDIETKHARHQAMFQSTPPCGGRCRRKIGLPRPFVSIHAPVRGAIRQPAVDPRQGQVSIHAPVRGAILPAGRIAALGDVSIHAPVRGAIWLSFSVSSSARVSIHAPVRGAICHKGHAVGG